MRRLCLLALLVLTGCQFRTPVQQIPPTAEPAVSAAAVAETTTVVAAAESAVALAPTWTPAPAISPTAEPTATLTPQPTLTPLPTTTPTTEPAVNPVVLITRPLPNEFVPATISVTGKVANVTSGTVSVELRSPDGQPLGTPAVPAPTSVLTDSIAFAVEIPLQLPPTPRPFAVHVTWAPAGGSVAAEATQPINVLGRFPRIDGLTLDEPQPFVRSTGPTITVRGAAPGPPVKVLVRMLDDADQVLESVEAALGWYQPGNPCDFGAELSNNPAGTQVQVIALGPDDAVLEAVRVRLNPRN